MEEKLVTSPFTEGECPVLEREALAVCTVLQEMESRQKGGQRNRGVAMVVDGEKNVSVYHDSYHVGFWDLMRLSFCSYCWCFA